MFSRDKAERRSGAVYLSAFGKHPGWDDHIEDIGIETNHLAALKQLLYVQGIGGTIDSGAWDNLTDVQRAEGFHHVFVSRSAGTIVVGRLWSSTDGKGRARYPMVVCAECVNLPLRWAVQEILPRLEALQARCEAVTTAADVLAITDQAREEYRALAAAADPAPNELVISPRTLAFLAESPEMGENHEGLLRVLYEIEREMSPYLRGHYAASVKSGELRPAQMRVPACGESPEEAILQWVEFLLGQLDPAAEMWALVRLDQRWVDLFVGAPAPQQFFCFQASREALPLASEIPYTLDEEFVERSHQRIEASRTGSAEPVVVEIEAPSAARREGPGLADTLRSLLAGKTFRIGLIAVILAALAVALLVAAISLWPADRVTTPAKKTPADTMAPADAEAWDALCTAFYEWFGSFLADLDKSRLERWEQDAHLREHVLPTLKAAHAGTLKLDPRRLANFPGSNLRFMGKNPPKSAQDPNVVAETAKALGIVRDIEKNLGPAGWVTLQRLNDLAGQYRARGWLKPAGYITAVVAQVRPTGELAGAVDRLVGAAARVEALEKAWANVQSQVETLQAAKSPVLAMFGPYALAETKTAADLDDLARRVRKVATIGSPLVRYVQPGWQDKLDMEMVRTALPVDVPSGPGGLQGERLFEGWLTAIQGEKYQALSPGSDPRTPSWKTLREKTFSAVGETIVKLRTEHKDPNAPALAKQLDTLRGEYQAICSIAWSRKNKETVEQKFHAFAAKPTALSERVNEILLDNIGGIATYIESLPRTISTTSPAINRYWQGRLGEIKKIKALGTLRAKEKALRAALGMIESELHITLVDKGGDKDWMRELSQSGGALIAKREALLSEALATLTWTDHQVIRGPKFKARWKASRAEFDRWRDEVSELAAALTRAKAALDAGASTDEKLPGGSETLGQAAAQWRARPLWREKAVVAVFEPVIRRIDRLAEIAKLSDRQALVREAGGAVVGRFEAAREAWKRLGALPDGWPLTDAEFDDEIRAHRRLAAVYGPLPDGARKKQLRDELLAGTRRRWEAYLQRQSDPARVDEAIENRKDFYVEPDSLAGLQPITQFRVGLYGFRRKILDGAGGNDKALKKEIRAFLTAVAALPGEVSAKAPVAGLVAEMNKLTAAGDSGADLTKAGPGVALPRVKCDIPPDGSYVRYAWTTSRGQVHSLRFVRIEPAGRKASYLCTTEVSVGFFIDVVKSMRKWREFSKLLKSYSSPESDSRLGPRTWELAASGKEIVAAVSWCRLPTGVPASKFYSKLVKVGSPKRGHPVQYVSPQAAGLFARLLGCRLPAAAEWLAAWTTHEKAHKASSPNRRDKTWAHQRDQIRGFEDTAEFGGVNTFYPDAGIFWPKGFEKIVEGRDAKALDANDGLLWFDRVNAGQAVEFHHIVGNVAEWTFEDSEALAKTADSASVVKCLAGASGKLAVIGGSALSDPGIPTDAPQPVDFVEAAEGYSDVGFRLAFTAPAESLSVRLRRLLTTRGYLTTPSK